MNSPARHAEAAAANNAHWCDLVCRSHGLDPRFDLDAWTSRTRTPLRYPDAVTLAPGVSPTALLARIDVSEGCSVKDSFASLDLTDRGFRVLFEAEWIVRIPGAPQPSETSQRWAIVSDADGFGIWERAWRGDDGPSGVLRPDLLDHDSVSVLAAYAEDRLVAGVVLNRTAEVVGISNFFADPTFASTAWDGCVGFATMLFPGSTLVGYQAPGPSPEPDKPGGA